jgi:hypothetical protein
MQRILDIESHAENISENYKYYHYSLNIHIYILLLFLSNNRRHFKINSNVHNINTRNNLDFHYPQARLSVYQKVHIIPGSSYLTDQLVQ